MNAFHGLSHFKMGLFGSTGKKETGKKRARELRPWAICKLWFFFMRTTKTTKNEWNVLFKCAKNMIIRGLFTVCVLLMSCAVFPTIHIFPLSVVFQKQLFSQRIYINAITLSEITNNNVYNGNFCYIRMIFFFSCVLVVFVLRLNRRYL